MVAIKLILVLALCETAFAVFPMLKLKQEYADNLHNNKGAFCLNKACVGLAGNQAGFVEMSLGTYKNDELANLPGEKHMAKHGMICFGGICAGIDEDMPYMMFHGLSQDNPDSNVIGIKEENGFICLEGSCVHFTGNPNDGVNIMKQFNKNGVKMAHAEFVGIFSNNKFTKLN